MILRYFLQGNKLEGLMTELNAFYNDASNCSGIGEEEGAIMEGQYFAARHTDGFWYRVKVANVIDNENVAVRYVDYG